MTGTRQIAYLHEPPGDYRGAPTDSTYKPFGLDPALDDLSFERALSRLGLPDTPETVDTVANRFEGAVGVSFVASGEPWYLDHVFGTTPTDGGESSAPYSYTWTPTLGRLNSARLFTGVDYLNGTAERELEGVVFSGWTVDLTEGEDVRVSLTGFYGDETLNASLTPGSVAEPSGTPLVYHSGALDVGGTTQVKVQSATLEVQNGARAQRGLDPRPLDAVTGSFQHTLDLQSIFTETDQIESAYGADGATSTSDRLNGLASGQLAFTTPGATALTVDLTRVTPPSYAWQDLLDRDADLTEDVQYVADELSVTAETDDASAQ